MKFSISKQTPRYPLKEGGGGMLRTTTYNNSRSGIIIFLAITEKGETSDSTPWRLLSV